MKYLIGSGRNLRQFYNHATDELQPDIEMVLTVYERIAKFLGTSVTHTEECEVVRVVMEPQAARELGKRLMEWADEAEDLQARTQLSPKEKPCR
jgi:L-fucose isomerase-like protein